MLPAACGGNPRRWLAGAPDAVASRRVRRPAGSHEPRKVSLPAGYSKIAWRRKGTLRAPREPFLAQFSRGSYALAMGIEELLKHAKLLEPSERRQLAARLLTDLEQPDEVMRTNDRLNALDRFLELAGTGHSDFADVSSDK